MTKPVGERVATLETKFDALKETVEVGFKTLGDKIDKASLNGETPRVKNMSRELGDPDDVEILASMVESHKRWGWLLRPVAGLQGGFINAIVWTAAGASLAWLNSIVHAAFPAIP